MSIEKPDSYIVYQCKKCKHRMIDVQYLTRISMYVRGVKYATFTSSSAWEVSDAHNN
jgi:hypothetical protein